MEFSEEEAKILSPYFTNVDKSVFALRNLPEVVKGALFSRYSRTSKSLRKVLLDEFIQNEDMAFAQIVNAPKQDETIAIRKAEEFYDRVLVGYGDDSVAELGGAHIALERVSNVATKIIEDNRIGLSPLEKSTRYVYFNEKIDGKYQYYREPKLMELDSKSYEEACDFLFETYSNLMEPMTQYFMKKFPKGEETDRAYGAAIRAKVCDSIRGLLPAATLTNVGVFGNGRAFEYLLTKLYSSEAEENRNLAQSMQEELGKVIPSFVKRCNDQYGKATQEFFKISRENLKTLEQIEKTQENSVEIVDFDADAEDKIVSAILYEHSEAGMATVNEHVKNLPLEKKLEIIEKYCGHRQNRRHKPGRAFEHAFYTFSIKANYGAYRDLQRHRMLTQQKQLLTVKHGFLMPAEIVDAGFEKEFAKAMQVAASAFEKFKSFPVQAQYVVPMAYNLQWYIKINLRAAFHLIELRSMMQGHPDYRKIAHQMFHEINKIHPNLAKHMKFVDLKMHGLERIESEKKIDEKMAKLNLKS